MDGAGLHVQRRVQRQSAVTIIFKAMPLGASGRRRQHRIESVQRLNRCLFVDAKHRGVLRRIHVQNRLYRPPFLQIADRQRPCSGQADAASSVPAPTPAAPSIYSTPALPRASRHAPMRGAVGRLPLPSSRGRFASLHGRIWPRAAGCLCGEGPDPPSISACSEAKRLFHTRDKTWARSSAASAHDAIAGAIRPSASENQTRLRKTSPAGSGPRLRPLAQLALCSSVITSTV